MNKEKEVDRLDLDALKRRRQPPWISSSCSERLPCDQRDLPCSRSVRIVRNPNDGYLVKNGKRRSESGLTCN